MKRLIAPPFLREEERTRCEIWTRVMGYHRPLSQFNPAKQSEHRERVPFREARVREALARGADMAVDGFVPFSTVD